MPEEYHVTGVSVNIRLWNSNRVIRLSGLRALNGQMKVLDEMISKVPRSSTALQCYVSILLSSSVSMNDVCEFLSRVTGDQIWLWCLDYPPPTTGLRKMQFSRGLGCVLMKTNCQGNIPNCKISLRCCTLLPEIFEDTACAILSWKTAAEANPVRGEAQWTFAELSWTSLLTSLNFSLLLSKCTGYKSTSSQLWSIYTFLETNINAKPLAPFTASKMPLRVRSEQCPRALKALQSILEQTHRKPTQGRGARVYAAVRKETHLGPR